MTPVSWMLGHTGKRVLVLCLLLQSVGAPVPDHILLPIVQIADLVTGLFDGELVELGRGRRDLAWVGRYRKLVKFGLCNALFPCTIGALNYLIHHFSEKPNRATNGPEILTVAALSSWRISSVVVTGNISLRVGKARSSCFWTSDNMSLET